MSQPIGDADEVGAPPDRTIAEIDAGSVVRLLVVALGAAAVLALVQQAPSMLTKIGVGIVLALALDPVVVRVQKRFRWQRGTAVGLVGTILGMVFLGVLVVLGPAAIDQASSLRDDLPATIEDAYSWPIVGAELEQRDAAMAVENAIDELPSTLDNASIRRYAEDLLGGLLTTVVVLVTAVAVMLDGARLVERFRAVVRPERGEQIDAIGQIVYRTFGNYFAGSLFVAILNGLVVLTLALALGIPLAPLAGLWSALTNLIPQIGGFLGGSFLVLLALTEGPVVAAIAAAVFLVYQNIENNVIQPAVVGKAVDLTPPTTMLAAMIGGAVAGVPGALIATPIIGAAKVLYLRDRSDGRIDLVGITRPSPTEDDD
ncbi:AI-2E family transporter [Actinospongicola halichondriae]|uniref:AI-2E family transporter n=1 Tax=Actinospongicola halichondriae TaxID=3236844 RepID=UPI003D5639C7